jgi:hypothetical protein
VTDERWQLAYLIYEAAASLATPERQQFVDATAPDAEIAGKVLEMLDEMESAAESDGLSGPAYSTEPGTAPASSKLPEGATLGRFVITGLVGQGGMGRVYSAHDPDLDREVALKVIAQEADASSSESFIREAQAASALNHPNIVTVHEVIRFGSSTAIAMELVAGKSLRHVCSTAQPVKRWLFGDGRSPTPFPPRTHGVSSTATSSRRI